MKLCPWEEDAFVYNGDLYVLEYGDEYPEGFEPGRCIEEDDDESSYRL